MPQRGSLIFLGVVLALLLPALLQIAWPFLTSFIVAAILAIVMYPAKTSLTERTGWPGLATFLITLSTVLILGTVVTFVGIAISRELSNVYDSISQRSLAEGGFPALVTHTADRLADALAARIPVDKEAIREQLLERMKLLTGYVLSNIGAAVGGVASGVVTGVLVTIFLYFLLRYGEHWVAQAKAMMPLEPRVTENLFQTVNDSVIANVNGVLVVAIGQGLLLMAGFWFVGMRSPVLWGAVGGLASLVPVLGAPLVWVPVVIAYAVMGSYGKALALGLWGGLVAGSLDNVLRPIVVGAREKQHPMLIALAAIGGTVAFGALGILLGPLIVSLVGAVLKEIQLLMTPRLDGPG